jgi:itaconate CoA-transferase
MTASWTPTYAEKLRSAEEAARLVRPGDTIVVATNLAEPPALLEAIAARARAGEIGDLKVYSFNPQPHVARTLFAADLCDCVQGHAWFVSGGVRGGVKVGLVHFVPSYFHQVPRLLRENMKVDVVVSAVAPPDRGGHCSFGNAGFMPIAARVCRDLLLEVNRHVPRTFGDAGVHVSEAAAIVEHDSPPLESTIPRPRPEDETIGRIVAERVPDGATLQLGIGGLPNAVAACLANHKDLGIHSELIGPGLVDLVRRGAATGRRKNLHPRKHVFCLAYGTRDTFEFLDGHPQMESYASDYVMDPWVVAQNDNMIAVNSILEVDLTGQCNAESIDGSQYSGTGGQLDFVRGAYRSRGGKAILAFYSTAKGGTLSRVVPRLKEGAMVTTPRMDVHYLATEHGIANLKGLSSRERALAIVGLAHPAFRDDLMREAEDMGLF